MKYNVFHNTNQQIMDVMNLQTIKHTYFQTYITKNKQIVNFYFSISIFICIVNFKLVNLKDLKNSLNYILLVFQQQSDTKRNIIINKINLIIDVNPFLFFHFNCSIFCK